MSLKKIISICLIAYVAITLLIVVFGLWIAPQRVAQTIPNPALQLSATTPDDSTSTSTTQSVTGGTPQDATIGQTTPTTIPTTGATSTSTPTPTPTPTPKPTPTPTPTPTPVPTPIACGSAGGTCTAAQVATHNTQTNCWMIYNNKYYIVTSYVAQHPGGKTSFNSTSCGHNVTSYLGGATLGSQKHTHSASAYTILSSYYVGPVSG